MKREPGARYFEIKQFVLDQLAAGTLRPGDRVASENELVQEFSVSRMTVNRALRELAAEGLVNRAAGVGTFVSEARVQSHPLEVRNIADEIRSRGHLYSARTISVGAVAADSELAQLFKVAVGTRLERAVILHIEGDMPLQVEDRFVNPRVIKGFLDNDFTKVTPHEFLIQAAPLQRAEHAVRAMCPDKDICKLLKLAPTDPCLLIRRRTWTDLRIATLAHLYHPGSRYELTGTFQHRSM